MVKKICNNNAIEQAFDYYQVSTMDYCALCNVILQKSTKEQFIVMP